MLYGLNVARDGGFRSILLAGLCVFTLLPGSGITPASAQGATAPRATASAPNAVPANARAAVAQPNRTAGSAAQPARRYFIELRARAALTYGHTFAIYGRVDGRGKIISSKVIGLHPFSEDSLPWTIGHVIPVPAETGASDGDMEDAYVIARFRILLNEAEYQKLLAYLKEHAANSPSWHAVFYNCNAFIGDVARFMGLSVPVFHWQMPQDYIDGIREANINRTDLTGVLGVPVKVQSANELRAAAQKAIAAQEKRGIDPSKSVAKPERPPPQPRPAAVTSAADLRYY
jgi:hypothetical protein